MVSTSRLIVRREEEGGVPLVSRRPLCMWVHALIYPRDHRVLVGRDIIVSRRASSVIAPRHDSPLLCILSPPGFASFVHTFFLAFVVWCVRGGVCGGRVIFWGGRCSGHPPPLHPTLHFFDPGPDNKTG